MKLLVFCHEYPPIGGGASNGLFNLAKAWHSQGHRVTVVTSAFGNESADSVIDGVRVIRISTCRRRAEKGRIIEMLLYLINSVAQTSRWRKTVDPDLSVAFMTIPAAPAAWLMKCLYRVPYIVELRGGDVPGFYPERLRLFHFFTKPWILMIWRQAVKVIANSRGLRQLALLARPGIEVEALPNGVDTKIFRPSDRLPARSRLRLIFVGRLEEAQKNVSGLIAVLRDLPEADLTIVGDGDDRDALQKKCLNLGVADRVHFEGWVSKADLPVRYREADVFVSLSLWEGMPNAALEAMASGLPLVLSDIDGHNELVAPEVNGALVRSDRPEELLATLARLAADAELRSCWGRAGRSRAVEFHDWHALAQRHLA